MDKYLHNIELLTYDMIYQRARRVIEFLEGKYNLLNKENPEKETNDEIQTN